MASRSVQGGPVPGRAARTDPCKARGTEALRLARGARPKARLSA